MDPLALVQAVTIQDHLVVQDLPARPALLEALEAQEAQEDQVI